MVEDRLYPCKINGKYYPEKVDIDGNVKEQISNIVSALESKYDDENNAVYRDEDFKAYIEAVKNGEIETILNPSNPLYRSIFDFAVLELGSYEFVQRLLVLSNDDIFKEYLESLDSKILGIQGIIIDYCNQEEGQKSINYIDNLSEIYTNFIKNFAPQRLQYYTSSPINIAMLEGIGEIEKLSFKFPLITEQQELANEFVNFGSLYSIDIILKVLELYREYYSGNSDNLDILNQIDEFTKRGVCVNGNNIALLNLSNSTSTQTLELMVDGIIKKIEYYEHDERLDISEELDQIFEKVLELKDIYTEEQLYTENRVVQKLLQISHLGLLPDGEKERLEDFLDNELGRKSIGEVDLSKFDSKIENKESFSQDEIQEFYNKLMTLTFKEGEMPVRYNEFFLAKIIEENPEFECMSNLQKIIIMENFARIKSVQLVGKDTYITFSTDFINRNEKNFTVGEHDPRFIKLRPISVQNQSMSAILSIITVFHELRHEVQQKHMDSEQYDHLTYMMVKERILKREDIGFYERNYSTIYEEIDAENFALNQTSSFVKTLPIDEQFKKSEKWNDILGVISKKLESTENGFKRAKNKQEKDGKLVAVEDTFDRLLKQHPEIIESFDILRIEYNEDGSIKPVKQIFEEFVNSVMLGENRLEYYDLYKYILFSRSGRNIEECLELSDVELPSEMADSTKQALNKIRYAAIEKGIEKLDISLDDDDGNR